MSLPTQTRIAQLRLSYSNQLFKLNCSLHFDHTRNSFWFFNLLISGLVFAPFFSSAVSAKSACVGSTACAWGCWRTAFPSSTSVTSAAIHQVRVQRLPLPRPARAVSALCRSLRLCLVCAMCCTSLGQPSRSLSRNLLFS